MSEEEERFLARWSRRKLEVPEAAPDSASPKPGAPGADAAVAPAGAIPEPPQAEAAAPAVDLSKLPSLESITAATDIRAFLTAGVPEQLKLAALRRTWTADPAIRDFKGLAENAWDFTAAESVPGFGPMLPTDDITRMVAQLTDSGEDAATKADSDKTAADSARELGAAHGESREEPSAMQAQSGGHARAVDAEAGFPQDLNKDSKTADMSVKNEPEPDQDSAGRNHGGAVPR